MDKILKDIINGKPIVVVDDYDRENEGDILIAAEKATVENIVFTMRYARGLMCIPAAGHILDKLEIPMMVKHSSDRLQTPFTVSVDAKEGISTGMSVFDRLKTIAIMCDENAKPEQLARPGHLFPLRARDNLLKDRRGHTESAIELMKLSGLKQVAIICEIMNDDGTMARGHSMTEFISKHNLSVVSVDEIYNAVYGI